VTDRQRTEEPSSVTLVMMPFCKNFYAERSSAVLQSALYKYVAIQSHD